MSGGGGSSQPTQTTVTNTSIPEYARPYVEDMLGRGQALTDINQNPYQQYGGDRTAGFNPMQQQAFGNLQNQGIPQQNNVASDFAASAGSQAFDPANSFQVAQDTNYYNPQQAGSVDLGWQNTQAPDLNEYQMGDPSQVSNQDYTGANVQQYMSPYMRNVVDQQKNNAVWDYARDLPKLGAASAQVGGLGGTRSALLESEANRNLQSQLQGIEATGDQAGFQNAQQQFNTQQGMNLQAQQANQQAGLTTGMNNLNSMLGVQQLGAGQNMQSQLANQQAGLSNNQMSLAQQQGLNQFGLQNAGNTAQYGLAGANLNQQSQMNRANLGMQGLQTQLGAAGQLGQLGQNQYSQQMGINQGLLSAGTQQQQNQQTQLNNMYQDFLNQQNYPYANLGFMSDLIRGTGATTQAANTMYGPQPNQTGQAIGGVASLAGLAGLFGKG